MCKIPEYIKEYSTVNKNDVFIITNDIFLLGKVSKNIDNSYEFSVYEFYVYAIWKNNDIEEFIHPIKITFTEFEGINKNYWEIDKSEFNKLNLDIETSHNVELIRGEFNDI